MLLKESCIPMKILVYIIFIIYMYYYKKKNEIRCHIKLDTLKYHLNIKIDHNIINLLDHLNINVCREGDELFVLCGQKT